MTGTPLDLTPFGLLLTGIGWFYWLLAGGGLWWALRGARPWKSKLIRVIPVLLIFGLIPFRSAWYSYQVRSRLDEAMALFEERCKTAGETIHQTVQNVDGVEWMKWRMQSPDDSDQFALGDPYGNDCRLEGCVLQLLRASSGAELYPQSGKRYARGYKFVETVDPRNGKRYQYTAVLRSVSGVGKESFKRHVENTGIGGELDGSYLALERHEIVQSTVRYGISWSDISTPQDRRHWIAGGILEAVDLPTNDVIARRIGFLIDTGQGGISGFRSPWGWARSYGPRCPRSDIHTSEFANKGLRPTKEVE